MPFQRRMVFAHGSPGRGSAQFRTNFSLSEKVPRKSWRFARPGKRKAGTPPRTVRYQDTYYRLEAASLGERPRPFHYTLRRLPVGVPGRTVLLYTPADAVIRQER